MDHHEKLDVEFDIVLGRETNPDNGEVTLFLENQPWGPIVTGADLTEAKKKMARAFMASMVLNSLCELERTSEHTDLEEIAKAKEELKTRLDAKEKFERELEEESV